MINVLLLNVVLSFMLLLVGLMFLEGIWQNKGRLIKGIINVDNLIFSDAIDVRILKQGNQLAFLVCLVMSVLTLLNGIISFSFPAVPNVSAIFVVIALLLSWLSKIVFVLINKRRNYEDISRVWPFKKP